MPKKSAGSPLPGFLQYLADHQAQLFFCCDSILVGCYSVYAVPTIAAPLWNSSFQTISAITISSWYPTFKLLVMIMTALSCFAVVVAILGLHAAVQHQRLTKVVALAFVVSCLLGFLALGAQLEVWALKPYTYRVVNLICQDTTIWSCEREFLDEDRGQAATGRRLTNNYIGHGEGYAAMRFEQFLRKKEEVAGSGEFCRRIGDLCREPPGFKFFSDCVCSGQWTVPDWDAENSSSLHHAPGYWRGTIGAYCGAWNEESPITWCYVSPAINCTEGQTGVYMVSGKEWTRGNGPCKFSVMPRSQVALEAFDCLQQPIQVLATLAALVLSVSFCALLQRWRPSKKSSSLRRRQSAPNSSSFLQKRIQQGGYSSADTSEEEVEASFASVNSGRSTNSSSSERQPVVPAAVVLRQVDSGPMTRVAVAPPPKPRTKKEEEYEMRFAEAQRQATYLLTDHTPEDLKVRLYAYHQQATEGNITGRRPLLPREAAKYDTWLALRDMSRYEAIEGYLRTVNLLDM